MSGSETAFISFEEAGPPDGRQMAARCWLTGQVIALHSIDKAGKAPPSRPEPIAACAWSLIFAKTIGRNVGNAHAKSLGMEETFSKRFSSVIVAVVLAGFWLALSPTLPGTQSFPLAWRPIGLDKTITPASPQSAGVKAAVPAVVAKTSPKIVIAPASRAPQTKEAQYAAAQAGKIIIEPMHRASGLNMTKAAVLSDAGHKLNSSAPAGQGSATNVPSH